MGKALQDNVSELLEALKGKGVKLIAMAAFRLTLLTLQRNVEDLGYALAEKKLLLCLV